MRHGVSGGGNVVSRLRGAGRRARRLRGTVTALGAGLVVMGATVWVLGVGDLVRIAAVASAVVGLAAVVLVRVVAPIPKVTWRAWVAGWWHARHVRRTAVNDHGHPSRRARRSATNRAAWAVQRSRDGRTV